jgi:dihydroorotate dehydrogenase (NAD+) catalytic subunit
LSNPDARLSLNLAGIEMATPLMAASGCYGYGFDYASWVDPADWGAIVVKGTTLQPRGGNPPPRLVETPSGMLNAIGLQNPGIDHFVQHIHPALAALNCPAIVNIAGESLAQYRAVAARLNSLAHVAGIEVNISCPNVEIGGVSFGCDPVMVEELVCGVREAYRGPVLVKLSLEAGAIVPIALAAQKAGADAVSLINTIKGMVIDVKGRRPVLGNLTGGLSGPAIRPVAVRAVWEVSEAVTIPVVGMGGIMNAADALQFILAGASALAVGTANFINPYAARDITAGLSRYLSENGIKHYSELIGAARSG